VLLPLLGEESAATAVTAGGTDWAESKRLPLFFDTVSGGGGEAISFVFIGFRHDSWCK
jgi:hypothetical protein